jgi:4-hydroxythreonine-4-phosphate dehydrogenase
MLANLTNASSFAMMMAGSKLRVTLVTIHCPLREVAPRLTSQAVYSMIRITHQALTTDFAIRNPRIAVAGLNPHGGENQLFGSEEQLVIGPAIDQAQTEHVDASGPYPPDTVFYKAASGTFDAVVCMYHDQGLIPFKLLHFDDGVNVTLGLPIVRTSVDHGTAYDIAGKGLASHRSLDEAIRLAASISRNRAAEQQRMQP